MLTSAHFRRPSLRNFNDEITGYMKKLLNSAFLEDFKWKGHFYLWTFCFAPVNILASTAALVWFVQFNFLDEVFAWDRI